MKVAHIGIAVDELAASLELFARLIGFAPEEALVTEVPEEGVRIAEIPLGNAEIELLAPLTPDSPLSRFLESHGTGIHHLCYEVEDVRAAFDRIQKAGFRLLSKNVKRARDYDYFFVHPRSAGGVLTEFKQKRKG